MNRILSMPLKFRNDLTLLLVKRKRQQQLQFQTQSQFHFGWIPNNNNNYRLYHRSLERDVNFSNDNNKKNNSNDKNNNKNKSSNININSNRMEASSAFDHSNGYATNVFSKWTTTTTPKDRNDEEDDTYNNASKGWLPFQDSLFLNEEYARSIMKTSLSSTTSTTTAAASMNDTTTTTREKEEWLESMLETQYKYVTTEHFLIVLNALAWDIKDAGAPRRAERWMRILKDHKYAKVTNQCYQAIIQAWANSSTEKIIVIVNRAERWLNELLQYSSTNEKNTIENFNNNNNDNNNDNMQNVNENLLPTIECYNAFLDACTRGRPGSNKRNQDIVYENAKKADALLRRLHSHAYHQAHHSNNYDDDGDDDDDDDDKSTSSSSSFIVPGTVVGPNTETFNYVIRGWTRCKQQQHQQQQRQQQYGSDGGSHLQQQQQQLAEMIPKKVLGLLRLMESYQRNDPIHSTVRPNTKSYAMVMDALITLAGYKARQCFYDANNNNNNNNLHHQGEKFITDITKNGIQEIQEATAILQYMHDLHDGGIPDVVPSTVAYNILLTGYANLSKYGHNNAAFKAEEILRKMLSYRDHGFYHAAPDRISFEKVMLAWGQSGRPNAGQRANYWLKKLWNDSELESDVKLLPVTHTYNIAIQALAASDGPLDAENLLLDLGDKYKQESQQSSSEAASRLCPNSESFAIVIRAWLQQSVDDYHTMIASNNNINRAEQLEQGINAMKRAIDWLSSLKEVQNETNLSTQPELYISVLKTAKLYSSILEDYYDNDHNNDNQRLEILDLAYQTFHDLRNDSRHSMNYVSYCLMLEIGLSSLSSSPSFSNRNNYTNNNNKNHHDDKLKREERWDFIYNLFHDCCEDGLLSGRFLRTIARSPVRESSNGRGNNHNNNNIGSGRHNGRWTLEECLQTVETLCGGNHGTNWPLPKEWSRNLPSRAKMEPKRTDVMRERYPKQQHQQQQQQHHYGHQKQQRQRQKNNRNDHDNHHNRNWQQSDG